MKSATLKLAHRATVFQINPFEKVIRPDFAPFALAVGYQTIKFRNFHPATLLIRIHHEYERTF
jgi:hypothetical protein